MDGNDVNQRYPCAGFAGAFWSQLKTIARYSRTEPAHLDAGAARIRHRSDATLVGPLILLPSTSRSCWLFRCLAGLAVLHVLARKLARPVIRLVTFYALAGLFGWPLLLVALLECSIHRSGCVRASLSARGLEDFDD